MEEILDVKSVKDKENLDKIIKLYETSEINETFGGFRKDRLTCAQYNFLITLNNQPIGFILLVKEIQDKKILFFDMSILKNFRNKGYGKKALIIFKERYISKLKEDIIAETKKDNLSINKIMNDLEFKSICSKSKEINKYIIKKQL